MARRDEESSLSASESSSTEENDAIRDIKNQLSVFIKAHLQCGENKGMDYTADQIVTLLDRAKGVFQKQDMLLRLQPPITMCGDVHGQFRDVKRLFRAFGRPPKVNYLFLGDYVDRGRYSLETVILLLAMKCRYPHTFFMLRGNHECANINRIYGFYQELNQRNFVQLYPAFNEVFKWMPVAALVGSKLLCMHGGISSKLKDLDLINQLPRPLQMTPPKIPQLALDLLWADPDKKRSGYTKSRRGVSHNFGMDVLEAFCIKHHLELIVRAHQVVPSGFERLSGPSGRIRCVTIFSAPNYCNEMDNNAVAMLVSKDLRVTFKALEPAEDAEAIALRNEQRATVPSFDTYPENEAVIAIDFEPVTRTVQRVADSTVTTIKSIPFGEYVSSARKGLKDFTKTFKKAPPKPPPKKPRKPPPDQPPPE